MWWPCLLTDRDEMSNLHRGHSIDASYQVSVHLAKRFQGRSLKCEKVNRRQTTSDDKSSHCLWQGELKNDTVKIRRMTRSSVESMGVEKGYNP